MINFGIGVHGRWGHPLPLDGLTPFWKLTHQGDLPPSEAFGEILKQMPGFYT